MKILVVESWRCGSEVIPDSACVHLDNLVVVVVGPLLRIALSVLGAHICRWLLAFGC